MKNTYYKIKRYLIRFLIFVYLKLVYRIQVIGIENIPKNGPVIFCGNHRNFLDAPLMEVTCKRDDTRFLAKEELTKNWYLAHLGKVFDVIGVILLGDFDWESEFLLELDFGEFSI